MLLAEPEKAINEIASYMGISPEAFDRSVMDLKLRGGQGHPRLGQLERKVLEKADTIKLIKSLGY